MKLEKPVVAQPLKIPNILWNMKVCYCVHKSLPQASILSQMSLFHTFPSYAFKIHFNSVKLAFKVSFEEVNLNTKWRKILNEGNSALR